MCFIVMCVMPEYVCVFADAAADRPVSASLTYTAPCHFVWAGNLQQMILLLSADSMPKLSTGKANIVVC